MFSRPLDTVIASRRSFAGRAHASVTACFLRLLTLGQRRWLENYSGSILADLHLITLKLELFRQANVLIDAVADQCGCSGNPLFLHRKIT